MSGVLFATNFYKELRTTSPRVSIKEFTKVWCHVRTQHGLTLPPRGLRRQLCAKSHKVANATSFRNAFYQSGPKTLLATIKAWRKLE